MVTKYGHSRLQTTATAKVPKLDASKCNSTNATKWVMWLCVIYKVWEWQLNLHQFLHMFSCVLAKTQPLKLFIDQLGDLSFCRLHVHCFNTHTFKAWLKELLSWVWKIINHGTDRANGKINKRNSVICLHLPWKFLNKKKGNVIFSLLIPNVKERLEPKRLL